jgi:hypothetical protein
MPEPVGSPEFFFGQEGLGQKFGESQLLCNERFQFSDLFG